MLSVQPIHCIKELLQMVVGPPVSTSCPFTFSNFQLFITLSRKTFFLLNVWCNYISAIREDLTIITKTSFWKVVLPSILPILLKSPIASNILKPGSGIWHRLPQWRMPFLVSPQTLSQTWPGHGGKWSQLMKGHLVSRCRGNSSDIQLHQHYALLSSV